MSSWRKRQNRVDPDKEFKTDDAYVVKIVSITNPVLRALVQSSHHSYCDLGNAKLMPLDEAMRVWRQNPRHIDRSGKDGDDNDGGDANDIGGVMAEEMPDVTSYIGEVMLQESESFNAERHDWSERHKRALHIRGTAIVSYDQGRSMARVVGEWSTFSRSVCLRIRGQVGEFDNSGGARMPVIDTSRKSADHGIEIAPVTFLTGRQFFDLLTEKGQMHSNEIRMHLQSFFKTTSPSLLKKKEAVAKKTPAAAAASSQPNYLNPSVMSAQSHTNSVMHQTLLSYQDVNAARERAAEGAMGNMVTLEDIWTRIRETKIDVRKFLETESVSLALRMVLLSQELTEIRLRYNSREVQLDCVARGVEYTRMVVNLMHESPHILCFSQLRRKYGDTQNMRQLCLLPDLQVDSYEMLMQQYHAGAIDQVRKCAVDIHTGILRYDVWGNGMPRNESSYPTANMCTVFGTHEDDRAIQYYHGSSPFQRSSVPDSPEALRAPNAMSDSGSFALPFEDMRVPPAGLTFNEVPPVLARCDHNTRLLLQADLRRLGGEYTTDEFMAALRWMIENGIIVRERFSGTGKHNHGMPVDAFYIASIYDLQRKFQESIADLCERAILQSTKRSSDDVAPFELIGLWMTAQETRKIWRQNYNKLMVALQKHRKSIKKQKEENAAAASTANPSASAIVRSMEKIDESIPEELADQIKRMARDVARAEARFHSQYLALELPYNDMEDAYADLRKDHWLSRMTLMRLRSPPFLLDSGVPFADEQVTAIKMAMSQPVTMITGRGGAGKSEIVNYLCKLYPPEQILCVALMGRNGSDLSRRTGLQAHTIHSVLFRETRYREAMYRGRSYRAPVVKTRLASGGKIGENMDETDIDDCGDVNELRAFIESRLEAYPPYTSPFESVRVLIVEEASLIDFGLMAQLIDAACSASSGHFIERLVIVGDLDQLPAIGYGNVQSDLAHAMPHSVCQLMKNHRAHGAALFELNQALAEHRYKLPMPAFDMATSMKELRNPDGASIVCIRTQPQDVAEMVATVYRNLGAVENEEIRSEIQCIATTNAEVTTAVETIRWLYFGQKQLDIARAAATGPIIRRIKAPRTANEASDSDSSSSSDDFDVEAQTAEIKRMMNLRILPGDCIYLTKNSKRDFEARGDQPARSREFYNGRLLQFEQAYDAMISIRGLFCRCGMCPPAPQDRPAGWRYPCVVRPDLVPELRRCRVKRGDVPAHRFFEWHNHKEPGRRDAARRMAVFREQDGEWIEVVVSEMLSRRNQFEFGQALTTHKMQGDQRKIILYICTSAKCFIDCHYPYTAISRTRNRCIILSTDEVFQECVRRKAMPRRSMLWFHLYAKIRGIMRKHSDAVIAREALAVYGSAANSEARWQVFESRRHKRTEPLEEGEMVVDEVVASSSSSSSSSSDEEVESDGERAFVQPKRKRDDEEGDEDDEEEESSE